MIKDFFKNNTQMRIVATVVANFLNNKQNRHWIKGDQPINILNKIKNEYNRRMDAPNIGEMNLNSKIELKLDDLIYPLGKLFLNSSVDLVKPNSKEAKISRHPEKYMQKVEKKTVIIEEKVIEGEYTKQGLIFKKFLTKQLENTLTKSASKKIKKDIKALKKDKTMYTVKERKVIEEQTINETKHVLLSKMKFQELAIKEFGLDTKDFKTEGIKEINEKSRSFRKSLNELINNKSYLEAACQGQLGDASIIETRKKIDRAKAFAQTLNTKIINDMSNLYKDEKLKIIKDNVKPVFEKRSVITIQKQ